jgi:hypothetical protein
VVDGRFQPLGHKSPPHALYRPKADAQSRDDFFVKAILAVRQKKDAGMGEFPGGCFSCGNQQFQLVPFIGR